MITLSVPTQDIADALGDLGPDVRLILWNPADQDLPEPERSRLSFGESLAIMVVVVSVVLLAWELLYLFKVLPIKLKP